MSAKKTPLPFEELATVAIHTGLNFRDETGAVMPPIYMTSTFEHGNPGGFDYTRSGNPNFRNLEQTLAALERSEYATVFASGVSAITAVVSTLKSGDLVLLEENVYGCTYRLFDKVFAKFGVETKYLDFSDPDNYRQIDLHRPALIWIESPTNPLLKLVDIEAISRHSRRVGSTLIVDNTFASSCCQLPLTMGADLVLLSTTKYINGHSDALGGVVCTNNLDWRDKMVFAQKALGLQPSPFDCWLIARGAKTAPLRMRQHCENALWIAEQLEASAICRMVRYPFLPSHPNYSLAKRQMFGGSGIICADMGLPLEETIECLKRLRLFTMAESLGGVESLICHPASMTHASVPKEVREQVGITDSMIRFSIGIERKEDLWQDILEGFGESAARSRRAVNL